MTQKDAYWFSHDSNAKDDPKVMMLIDQLGLEGYGIYWVLVETLRDQPGYRYPIKMLPILAKRYYTSGEKMTAVVSNYELFDINDDMFFFSHALNRRMLMLENKREKARIAGLVSAERRKQLAESNERSTDVEQTLNGGSTSTVQYSTVKDSKVKEIKETIEERARKFIDEVMVYKNKYSESMLKAFIRYWAEPTRDKKRLKCEMEKTWSIKGRLATWHSREHKTTTPEPRHPYPNMNMKGIAKTI